MSKNIYNNCSLKLAVIQSSQTSDIAILFFQCMVSSRSRLSSGWLQWLVSTVRRNQVIIITIIILNSRMIFVLNEKQKYIINRYLFIRH